MNSLRAAIGYSARTERRPFFYANAHEKDYVPLAPVEVEIADAREIDADLDARSFQLGTIRIGDRVNIQDGTVIHTLYQKSVSVIGNDVSIGHNVVIHGAEIKEGALIGMGAIVLDHAVVGEGAIIAAGSVVLTGTKVEPGSIYAGVPAKFVKKVDPEQSKGMNQKIANNYLMYAGWFQDNEEE